MGRPNATCRSRCENQTLITPVATCTRGAEGGNDQSTASKEVSRPSARRARKTHRIALWPEQQNNATPSLQPHYRTFITTTGCSAPVPRIGTLTLIGSTYLDFSLSIGATGSRVPHRRLVQGDAAFTPDAAWAAIRPPPRLVPG